MIVHEDVVACGLDLPVKRRMEGEAVEAPCPSVPTIFVCTIASVASSPPLQVRPSMARVILVAAARRGTREPPNRWERAFATGAHRTLFCGL